MIIGVDFDNTIVCYDKIFHTIAVEKGFVPETVKPVKEEVRNYLRKIGKENEWIELQGYVYGPGIKRADTFQGVKEFFKHCKMNNIKILIISHKTKEPFLGPKYDLHKHAFEWLVENGFFESETGLTEKDVFFELTKENKAERIKNMKCTHFIDDLPEFFSEKFFPAEVIKILYNPNITHTHYDNVTVVHSWDDIIDIFDKGKRKT